MVKCKVCEKEFEPTPSTRHKYCTECGLEVNRSRARNRYWIQKQIRLFKEEMEL